MAKDNDIVVVLLIDALGWEIVRRSGFCMDLLPQRSAMETVLGYSSAAIPTLLTGMSPKEHGMWAMYRFAPQTSPFRWLQKFPRLPHALEWRFRNLIKRIVKRRNIIQGYYDLYEIPLKSLGNFDVSQKRDPYETGSLEQETLFDWAQSAGRRFKVWTYRTDERNNFNEVRRAVSGDYDFLFWYTAELDALMHIVGTEDRAVRDKLSEYESFVRDILEEGVRAGRDVSFYVISDHGMTDVDTVVDLMGRLSSLGYNSGRDYHAFFDSTMARFWEVSAKMRSKLVPDLNATGWGRVLEADELKAHGCDFGDSSYGEVIFLVGPGKLIIPSYMGSAPIKAMHGYHPDDAFSKACILTNDLSARLPSSIYDLKRYFSTRLQPTQKREAQ